MLCDWELPIRQRSIIFLEIFGNCLVQERTSRYISRLGIELIDLIANHRGTLEGLVNLSGLKYRERDILEQIFTKYSTRVEYPLQTYRDHRIRHHFGDRYDYRTNLIDWDYQMRMKLVASIIHIKQYRQWRLNGVAFEFGDQTYTEANRTLCSYHEGIIKKGKDRGLKKEVRGYWGDIVISPYIAFGVTADRPNQYANNLFHIVNRGTYLYTHIFNEYS